MTLTIEEIDEIERDIAAFQRYGQPIPNNLLERKRILEQQPIHSPLNHNHL